MIHGKGGAGTALLDFQADGVALQAQGLVPLFGTSFTLDISGIEVAASVARLKFDDGGRTWVRFLADVAGEVNAVSRMVGKQIALAVLA